MNLDDVVYVICLLACIGAGTYVRKIPDKLQKKYISTSLGLLMVFIVSGFNSFHCLVSALLGAAAVVYVHPRNCHLAAFFVMFGYLAFFRLASKFGLPDPPGHINMIQMVMTLKISGIGFEKTAAWKKLKEHEKDDQIEITKFDKDIQTVNIIEIFHYSFNYIGILTGPYYRYRTYRDYFETSYADYAPTIQTTVDRLKSAGLYCSLYLLGNYIWPLDYALTDEFYNERSYFYRLWYVWPTFFIFRMRMYTGLTLSECVCTMAGFGAYPVEADVAHGGGPRKPYAELKPETYKGEYTFATIVNTNVMGVEKCSTFRETMKHWNICVQYWLAVNIYKLFPSKKYRTAATLLVSAYWHGFRPGHYFCLMGAPFYVHNEDMWEKLIPKYTTGPKKHIRDFLFWFFKFFCGSYLGTAFLLVTFEKIWRYYSSVYHTCYISWILFLVVGTVLTKQKKAEERRKKRLEENKTDEAMGKEKSH
ncbi:membrane bound O-acyltransferase domain containing farjavit [Haematobia irritans]|uniref:membrane bound O-acyltransferase domain containing farjavit n=1 Tax=Haematobia irritans TaxID=7368 RepID=UPI003F50CAC7